MAARDIPSLIEALRNKDKSVRWHAAFALGQIGPAAREAVPALIDALKDEYKYVREYAAKVLKSIDPDAATKAGLK